MSDHEGNGGYRTRRERRRAETGSDGTPVEGGFTDAFDSPFQTSPVKTSPADSVFASPAHPRPAAAPVPMAPAAVPPAAPVPFATDSDTQVVAAPFSRPAAGPAPLPAFPSRAVGPLSPKPIPDRSTTVAMAASPPDSFPAARGAVPSGPGQFGGLPPGPPGKDPRRAGPGRRGQQSLGQRILRDALEVLGTVAVALGIAIIIKTFLIQPFYIPSGSMEPTLEIGDRVLVSKLEPGPLELNRGDVVVFVDPGNWLPEPAAPPSVASRVLTFLGLLPANSGEHLIKRVIGLPGDTVKCCDAESRVLVNNQPLDETDYPQGYLFPGDSPSTKEFEVVVPEGKIWVMGDHRSISEDSRYHDTNGDYTTGAVPLDKVVGRAVLVMWPVSDWAWLSPPEGLYDGVGNIDGVR
jgi:signal peptidase I